LAKLVGSPEEVAFRMGFIDAAALRRASRMNSERLAIPDMLLITPPKFADSRGFFLETRNAVTLAAHRFAETFVQDNQSLSTRAGIVRGLHCQIGAPRPG
jgi:dTDP-4-dehydrorhamnose 3,5-epimerase-like enzyme